MVERDNNKRVLDMTKAELDDMIFFSTLRASKMANDSLFKGLSSFLYQYLEDFRAVMNELEFIKDCVKNGKQED